MLGEEGGKDAAGQHEHGDDVFLKKIESHLLTQARCLKGECYRDYGLAIKSVVVAALF